MCILTWVTNSAFDSVSTLEQELDQPWSYVTGGSSYTHRILCSTHYLSLPGLFLQFNEEEEEEEEVEEGRRRIANLAQELEFETLDFRVFLENNYKTQTIS